MQKIRRLLLRFVVWTLIWISGFTLLIVLPFRWIDPPLSMVMVERWWNAEDADFKLRQHWLSWQQIPKRAALAVVASEDQRFPYHFGFDVDSIVEAIQTREQGGDLRGASTISQQVARNVYLWTGRSWLRKGIEAWLTVFLELLWGKQRILEVYLNIAEWGPGVFGIAAASQYYFDKPASQLTPMQQALLAATLPSPLHYNPAQPDSRMRERAVWDLQQQQRLGGVNWLQPLH